MVAPKIEELLAAIRQLPLDERLRLVERAAHDAAENVRSLSAAGVSPPSLVGLMADEPDVVDRMCSAAYEARAKARMRAT
jgi:hypothetical protein